MNTVDEPLRPASAIDESMLRKQARENLKRAIDTWLARTAAGGSTTVTPRKMLRSNSVDAVEPVNAA